VRQPQLIQNITRVARIRVSSKDEASMVPVASVVAQIDELHAGFFLKSTGEKTLQGLGGGQGVGHFYFSVTSYLFVMIMRRRERATAKGESAE
jgi:hypothetical protein